MQKDFFDSIGQTETSDLGYKSLVDPHSRTLRNLYRWAFSFHLWLCAYEAAGPVLNPEQPEFSPPRANRESAAEICQTLPTIPRFHGPTRNRIPPAAPCEIDPATASHEEVSSRVATGRLDILFANSQFRNVLDGRIRLHDHMN